MLSLSRAVLITRRSSRGTLFLFQNAICPQLYVVLIQVYFQARGGVRINQSKDLSIGQEFRVYDQVITLRTFPRSRTRLLQIPPPHLVWAMHRFDEFVPLGIDALRYRVEFHFRDELWMLVPVSLA